MQQIGARPTQNGRRKRRRVTPRFWFILGLVVLASIATSYVSGFIDIWRMQKEMARIEAEIAAAEERIEELRRELDYVQSQEYIEKVAREELGLVMPGETPVIVVPGP